MFETWHDFYLMVGPSAAALIGLVFVVVTLRSGVDEDKLIQGTQVYTTPTVFHLGVVVMLSGAALSPLPDRYIGDIAVVTALAGCGYAVFVILGLLGGKLETFIIDVWCYGIAVAALYGVIGVSGAFIALERPGSAIGLSAGLLVLLLLMIHNAWDLVTWLAPHAVRHGAAQDPDKPGP